MNGQDWLALLNSVGFPLVALYAYIKGYVVSPRELTAFEERYQETKRDGDSRYHELKARYDKLEAEVKEERAAMRGELAETRSILYRVLMGEIAPGSAIAKTSGD